MTKEENTIGLEVWQPNVQLRYFKRAVYKDNGSVNVLLVGDGWGKNLNASD